MRYGIIGDVHGADLRPIDKVFEQLGVGVGICTGDFDSVEQVRQVIELQRADRIPWYVVPGNHEHSNIHKDRLSSHSASLWREWDDPDNSEIRAYVINVLSGRPVYIARSVSARQIVIEIDGIGKTIIMHGAYSGVSWGDPPDLWNRLQNESDYAENFEAMKRKGYNTMIRGHDHPQMYGYGNAKKAFLVLGNPGQSFDLKPEFMHTINPGAFCDGLFATIDDAAGNLGRFPRLLYHQL